jgi:hypothetical protein
MHPICGPSLIVVDDACAERLSGELIACKSKLSFQLQMAISDVQMDGLSPVHTVKKQIAKA